MSLITKNEACAMLRVSIPTLNRWIKKGYITAYRVGRSVRVDQVSIVERLECSKIK